MKVSVRIAASAVVLALALSSAAAQQKTAKACADEWRANKADNKAKGITERAYVAQCRAGTAAPAAAATTTSAPTGASTTAPNTRTTSIPRTTSAPPAAKTVPAGANQFATEAQAKGRCPTDTVVWVNLKSNVYHFAGQKDYGTTKSGAYMCERDTAAAGARAAKNEKHP
jgi:hypothetical protein